jgi:hypothetical protein
MVVPKNPRLREETPQPTSDATSPSMSCACDFVEPGKSTSARTFVDRGSHIMPPTRAPTS